MCYDKGIFTIAVGKKYAKQAKYFALSCMLHAPHLPRAVLSDQPKLLSSYYDIVVPFSKDVDDIFSLKTRLHQFTPFKKTLFLDADSLIMRNIDSYWDYIKQDCFAYSGGYINSGEWYYDISDIKKKLRSDWFVKFNSGMLLFDSSQKVQEIFNTANYYFFNHAAEGIKVPFHRGNMYSDEPFLAIAFVKNNIKPVDDSGRFSSTLINASRIHINVIKGISFFVKDSRTVFPLVVHFCGRFGGIFYFMEKLRLYFYFNNIIQSILSGILSFVRKVEKKSTLFFLLFPIITLIFLPLSPAFPFQHFPPL
jgi:hypothetical protein